VAAAQTEAIVVLCTNMRGALIAPALEAELGVPILDSVAFALWGALSALAIDHAPLARWGRLFQSDPHRPGTAS
jgi:maleate isomerase